ncbi:MAG: hypothetical protein JW810_00160, partial [Sedimentisphaerales bacterium]|nr:hypothetical protein [Sedimentisphaerales bacterium]
DDLGNIDQIWLNDTTDASQLIVKSSASTPIQEILVDGSLGSLKAKTLNLTDRLEITGGLGQLTLHDIGEDAQIVGGAAPASGMKWKVNQVADGVDFLLAGSVQTFQAYSFAGGSLAADDLGKVKIKTGDVSVDFRAQAGDLDALQVAGNLTGTINTAGNLGKILSKSGRFEGVARAGGDILKFQVNQLEDAVLSAGGDVVKVAVKSDMIDSYILGGYDLGADAAFGTQQAGGDDALNGGDVYQVSIKGRFVRGYVAAGTLPAAPLTAGLPAVGQVLSGTIGKVKFGRVEYLSAAETFGLYAASAIQSVKIGNDSEAAGAYFEILDYSA